MRDLSSATVEHRLVDEIRALRNELRTFRADASRFAAEIDVGGKIPSNLTEATAGSFLEWLRTSKTLLLPPGSGCLDRFLLELYKHEHSMSICSLYFRPASIMWPSSLLKRVNAPSMVIERSQLLQSGLRSGKYTVTEVLNFSTLDDLIRYCPKRGFQLYPPSFDAEDVAVHLNHLIEVQESVDGYELVFTPAPLPFHFATYMIQSPLAGEAVTLFFRNATSGYFDTLSGFAVHDRAFGATLTRKVVDWIVKDPSSVRDRQEVVYRLSELRRRALKRQFLERRDE